MRATTEVIVLERICLEQQETIERLNRWNGRLLAELSQYRALNEEEEAIRQACNDAEEETGRE